MGHLLLLFVLAIVNLAHDPAHDPADDARLSKMRDRCDELRAAAGPAPVLSEGLFRTPPLSARPMVLWPWLNGHVDRQ